MVKYLTKTHSSVADTTMGLICTKAVKGKILLLAVGSISWLSAQDVLNPAEFTLPCLVGRHQLKDEFGSPVVLDPAEMNRRAMRTAVISVPPGAVLPDTVTAEVVIDEKGHVACASVSKGSLERLGRVGTLALEAAKKWVFQPVLNDTKPVLCVGELELRVVEERH